MTAFIERRRDGLMRWWIVFPAAPDEGMGMEAGPFSHSLWCPLAFADVWIKNSNKNPKRRS